ncbi:4-amino-4-deoxy-L-arabinose-phospho-UDP flippase [Enterobacterales bacterium CwR94]|nr:4-amino-4-deoxy-L-arabinose-phospho-UDP flippase [Enterobacterales bacterium CwR94]
MNVLLIILVCLLTCSGQLCQKHAMRPQATTKWRWLLLSLALLGMAMLLWLRVLQQVPVSVAYPMLSFNVILVMAAARWLWNERISLRHWSGAALLLLGVIVMSGFTG